MAKTEPSVDQWLREAKADPAAAQCGMFLTHNGVVRITPKAQVREGVEGLGEVAAAEFSYDAERGALRGGRFAHVRAHRRRYPPQLHRRAAEARGAYQE